MPATAVSKTANYEDLEERRYNLRIASAKGSISPPPDSRPQHEFEVAIEGTKDPTTGGEIKRRMWVSHAWNEGPEKISHQYLLARGTRGNITREQWDAIEYEEMVGYRFSAMVTLNEAGWPTINKDTIKAPMDRTPTAAVATSAAPAQAQLPNKPTRPGFLPKVDPNLRTDEQVAELMGRAASNDPPMSAADVEAWVAGSYPGTTVATLTKQQASDLIDALLPF